MCGSVVRWRSSRVPLRPRGRGGLWCGVALVVVSIAVARGGPAQAGTPKRAGPDFELFTRQVRPFLCKHCATVDCHGGLKAGKLHLKRTRPKPFDETLRQDYKTVLGFVNPGSPKDSPLILKPLPVANGGMKHKAKFQLRPGSKGMRLLSAWISGKAWKEEPRRAATGAKRSKAKSSKRAAKPLAKKPATKKPSTKKPAAKKPATGPVANAGTDQNAMVGAVVRLDGRGSRGKDLTYKWRLAARPDGSRARLVGAESATPSLQPDREGLYKVSLQVVEDGRPSLVSNVGIFAKAKGGGAIVLEAEKGDLVAPLDVISDPDASQKSAIGIAERDPVGGTATWRFMVAEPGLYRLFASVKNPGTALTALSVRVDTDKEVFWHVGQCTTWEEQPARHGSLHGPGRTHKPVWQALKGKWRVRGGAYRVAALTDGDSAAALTPSTLGEGTLDADVQVLRGDDAGAYLVFDYRGEGHAKFAGVSVSGGMALIGPKANPSCRRPFTTNFGRTYRLTVRLRKGPGSLYLAQLFVDDKLLVERLYDGAFVGRVGVMARGQAAFSRFRIARGDKVVREDRFDQAGPDGAGASLEPIEWSLGQGTHSLTVKPLVKGVQLDRLMLRKVER